LATATVRGESAVLVDPDEVALRLTLTDVQQTVDEAYEEVAKRAARLSGILSELGVDEAARSTSAVLVREEREYDERGRAVHRGFSATSLTHVRLTDVSIVGTLIKHAVAGTAAQVEGPWWQAAPENPARLEACRQAASIARAKAEAYAEALGVRLGALTEVSEPDLRSIPRIATARYAAYAPQMDDSVEIPIESGALEIRAIVDVTFALEPS
jgi:uncharacterized protein YggE